MGENVNLNLNILSLKEEINSDLIDLCFKSEFFINLRFF